MHSAEHISPQQGKVATTTSPAPGFLFGLSVFTKLIAEQHHASSLELVWPVFSGLEGPIYIYRIQPDPFFGIQHEVIGALWAWDNGTPLLGARVPWTAGAEPHWGYATAATNYSVDFGETISEGSSSGSPMDRDLGKDWRRRDCNHRHGHGFPSTGVSCGSRTSTLLFPTTMLNGQQLSHQRSPDDKRQQCERDTSPSL